MDKQEETENILKQVVGVKKMCENCFSYSGLTRDEVEVISSSECSELKKAKAKEKNGIS